MEQTRSEQFDLTAGERASTSPSRLDLEVVVPAFNEERRIRRTLQALTDYLRRQDYSAGVIVVDNGSVDRTAEVVDSISSSPIPVRLIGCSARGKGAAVRRGVFAARARWVGFQDADLATPIETLSKVVPRLAAGDPVVIGSRRCDGASYEREQPPIRRFGGYAFRRMVGPVSDQVTDTQCGFKFFQTDVARRLFGDSRVDGFAFDIEILARASEAGMRISEVPVQWSDDDDSSFRPLTDGRDVLREVVQMRRRRSSSDRRPPVAA